MKAARKITNRFAIISLVLAIVSILIAQFAYMGSLLGYYTGVVGAVINVLEFLIPLAAMITGSVALHQIKVRAETGKIQALIGIILGGLIVSIQVLFLGVTLLGLY